MARIRTQAAFRSDGRLAGIQFPKKGRPVLPPRKNADMTPAASASVRHFAGPASRPVTSGRVGRLHVLTFMLEYFRTKLGNSFVKIFKNFSLTAELLNVRTVVHVRASESGARGS